MEFKTSTIDQTVISVGLSSVSPEVRTRNYLTIAECLVSEGVFDNRGGGIAALFDAVKGEAVSDDQGDTVAARMTRGSFVSRIGEAVALVCAVGVTEAGNVRSGYAAEWIEHYNVENGTNVWSLQSAKLRKAAGIVKDETPADDSQASETVEEADTVGGDKVAAILAIYASMSSGERVLVRLGMDHADDAAGVAGLVNA